MLCPVSPEWGKGRTSQVCSTLHHQWYPCHSAASSSRSFSYCLQGFQMRRNRKFLSLSGIPVFIKHIPACDPTWSSRQLTSCTGQFSFSPFHRFVWNLRSEAAAIAQRLRALATLIENPVSIPSTHITTYTCLSGWLQRQTDVSRVWLPS